MDRADYSSSLSEDVSTFGIGKPIFLKEMQRADTNMEMGEIFASLALSLKNVFIKQDSSVNYNSMLLASSWYRV